MGLELIIGGLSALAGVVGGIGQAIAASNAAAREREANAIQSAQQQVAGAESRRQRIREERMRRAMILASSENTGTTGSSGQIGAVGALSTNLQGLIGSSLGESKANAAVNRNLQSAADFEAQGKAIGAWTDVFQSGLKGFQTVFDK